MLKALIAEKVSNRISMTHEQLIEEAEKKIEYAVSECSNDEYDIHKIVKDIIREALTTAMQRAYEAGRADWLRSEIEKLEGTITKYVWENGECSVCGYDSVYSEGEEHRCEVFNDALTSIITRYKEELKVLTGE